MRFIAIFLFLVSISAKSLYDTCIEAVNYEAELPCLLQLNGFRRCKALSVTPEVHGKPYVCGVTNPNSKSAKLKIFLYGNSYAMRHYDGFKSGLSDYYSEFHMVAQGSCSIFSFANLPKWMCDRLHETGNAVIDDVKPDVVIVVQKTDHIIPFKNPPNETLDEATILSSETFQALANKTRLLLIVESNPSYRRQSILTNTDIPDGFKIPKDQCFINATSAARQLDPSWDRITASISNCSNCVALPMRDIFCNGPEGQCPMFTSDGEPLLCDATHAYTNLVKKIVPRIIDAIKTHLLYLV
uniref:SGNH domain-containing protein n=1 Tax=Panagrellus redivivus TaxID=6233 RepID=A0A7E5A000_PANRE